MESNEREHLTEAQQALQRMLAEGDPRDTVLLVTANKQCLPNAVNAAEITDKLGDLHSLWKNRGEEELVIVAQLIEDLFILFTTIRQDDRKIS